MSGDAVGELKIKVYVDLDVDGARKQHEQIAQEATSEWDRATQAHAQAQVDAQQEAAEHSADAWKGRFNDAAKAIGAALLGAAAAGAAFVTSMVQQGNQIDRQARSLGMSTDEVQRWRYVAEQAGLEGNDLGEAIGGLAQRANDAAQHGGDAAKRFRDMGISLTDASGAVRPANELMLDAADALRRMGPGTEQTATAMQLFGDKGRLLLPVLSQGRAGISAMTSEFDQLGGGLDAETIESMAGLTREINRAKVSLMGALAPAVRNIVDWMRRFAEKMTPAINHLKDIFRNSHLARAALITLGGIAAGVAAAMLVAYAPIAAVIFGIVVSAMALGLAADELITTFEGGDSVIRRFVDGLFGIGTTARIVASMKQDFDRIMASIDAIVTEVQLLGAIGSQEMTALWNAAKPLHPLFEAIKSAVEFIGKAIEKTLPSMARAAAMLSPLGGLLGIGSALSSVDVETSRRATEGARAANAGLRGGIPNPIIPLLRPATVTASPTANAAASNAAGGATTRNVNANSNVRVNITGLVDPQLADRLLPIVQQAIDQSNANAAEALAHTGGE